MVSEVSCFKSFRAFVLHHGPSVERQNLAKVRRLRRWWKEEEVWIPWIGIVYDLCVISRSLVRPSFDEDLVVSGLALLFVPEERRHMHCRCWSDERPRKA